MNDTLRGTVGFKYFLVFFWCVWWLVNTIGHMAALGQYWGFISGQSLTTHYVNIATVIGGNHHLVSNGVFIIALLLQIIAAIHFLRALFTLGQENWQHNASHAFTYSLALFMILYGCCLTLQSLGADYSSQAISTIRMIIVQFLCTIFVVVV